MSISITIGTAAITRWLSTAAVVQARFLTNEKRISSNKINLLVQPRCNWRNKTWWLQENRLKTSFYLRCTSNNKCFWYRNIQFICKLLYSIHSTNRSLKQGEKSQLRIRLFYTLVIGIRRSIFGSLGFSRNVFHVHAIRASSPRLRLDGSAYVISASGF